ncbi:hypothetical protein [Streptomyces sp. SP18CS02]|uniref:hypothetical protein n=1 Tax=Streptomyces sp. SP18CS02 TaxID=3002531 RepID=UPI002E797503|nr:hypothetical protein [Streptomyces sp. SP18CS02]MEE1757245.1 hypothetical protein [Streptomyces sp. SP18CS02]
MPRLQRTAARRLALTATVLAVASFAAGPVQADDRLPSHHCVVNGAAVPPGETVFGTAGNDIIECENDVENVIVWGGGGDDNIRVKGLIIDSQVLGGDGNDTIQTSQLLPREASSTLRGGTGDDTIIVPTVIGTTEHGATVYGDQGNDKITTGSVFGSPGDHARGGGQVFGNDGSDRIYTGVVDFGGRVLGGSENDLIEAKGVGNETGGTIQGGPGQDTIRATGDKVLLAGPGWGVVDGGLGQDTCKVEHASPDRARSSISGCP